jgi:hypothetical protein
MGTHWELEREHVGTKGKKKKKFLPSLTPKLKKNKIRALSQHAEPSHWPA